MDHEIDPDALVEVLALALSGLQGTESDEPFTPQVVTDASRVCWNCWGGEPRTFATGASYAEHVRTVHP